ncbi:unnamed protein product [Trypanosoma congolense IL3000]|uniref:WGS project CAEQ00000000 data, annotated contig 1120 n=1 Tax=Trypanosoma congolense (strain IL3000) TaxID=1068625 RepID=F9W3W9_TRYCI|nr:unnamed protein product [Trypanosoma congolense IL3000]
MIQKPPEKQLKSDDIPVEQEASSDSDGEPAQEEQNFVCQKCNRVLKSKTCLTRHKCDVTSNINSEDSNVAEQSDTAVCPICSKQYHYKWLLRHMREKHPGHDESLRPQPRAKPKRKTMRSEAQAQDEGSRSTELAGAGDGEGERPRKRSRMGRHKEGEEGRDYVCGRCDSAYKQWYSLVWHTRTHHDHRYHSETEDEGRHGSGNTPPATIPPVPTLPMKCALKQYLTIHLQAKHGQRKKESEHNLLKAECEESAAHLLECTSSREIKKKHRLETLWDGGVFFSAQLAGFLKELFKLESPLIPPLDSPKLKQARAVNRHRSPTALDTTYPPLCGNEADWGVPCKSHAETCP